MPEVRSVRIGKYMEIDIEGQNGQLESRLHQLCRDLLSNPVIEDYELRKDQSEKREESLQSAGLGRPEKSPVKSQRSASRKKR
jgi:hypothetical protein